MWTLGQSAEEAREILWMVAKSHVAPLNPWDSIICWYMREENPSRVSWVIKRVQKSRGHGLLPSRRPGPRPDRPKARSRVRSPAVQMSLGGSFDGTLGLGEQETKRNNQQPFWGSLWTCHTYRAILSNHRSCQTPIAVFRGFPEVFQKDPDPWKE